MGRGQVSTKSGGVGPRKVGVKSAESAAANADKETRESVGAQVAAARARPSANR